MKHLLVSRRIVAATLAVAFCFMSVVVAPLQAALVATEEILEIGDPQAARDKVDQFLAREDVARQMAALGVPVDEAQARVQAMTDEEISLLAGKIDQLPAGGSAAGFIVVLLAVAFVVMIILDVAGVTDIFTFIKKH